MPTDQAQQLRPNNSAAVPSTARRRKRRLGGEPATSFSIGRQPYTSTAEGLRGLYPCLSNLTSHIWGYHLRFCFGLHSCLSTCVSVFLLPLTKRTKKNIHPYIPYLLFLSKPKSNNPPADTKLKKKWLTALSQPLSCTGR